MNTGQLLFRFFLVSIALAVVSCVQTKSAGLGGAVPGSGNVQTETRHTGGFEAIILEYPADVTVQQGAEDIVWIQADDNLIPQITTDVVSGRLIITTAANEWKARVNPSQPVKIAITVKNPREIALAAPAATLEVNDVKVETLKVVLSGAGDIHVAGVADELRVALSGLGNFSGRDLTSNKATIDLSGTGDATVRVETELTATIKGAGSVNYLGEPHVKQTVTGLGDVRPAGQGN